MRSATILSVVLLLALMAAPKARGQDDGDEALAQATEKRLSAESLADLNEVIRLCDEAIKKGLDEGSTEYANNLLTGTLLHRAGLLTVAIFDKTPLDPRWPELRGLAIKDLERAIKIDPKLGEAHYLIARLHATLPGGDHDRARKAIEQAVEHTKKDNRAQAKALTLRANLTEVDSDAESDEDKAAAEKAAKQRLADYAAAIELAEEDDEPLRSRGRFYLAQGKFEDAIADFDKALAIDSDNLEARLFRAQAYAGSGDIKEAREEIDQLLKDEPGLVMALELRASLAASNRDFKQAIADYEQILKIAPTNPNLLTHIGLLYQANKRPTPAIERFTKALEQDRRLFPALRARADAYLSIGKQAEAVADYERALKVQPKDSGVLNNLAWVLATSPDDELRDGKRAIELAKLACEVTEYKEAHILSTLAAAYAETGQWDEALEWSKKAVEMGDESIQEQLKKELESYEAKKPWREKQELEEEVDAPKDDKKEADPEEKKDEEGEQDKETEGQGDKD